MKELYPLKFNPIYKNTIWGGSKLNKLLNKQEASTEDCGESWEISGVENNISIVANGFLRDNNLQELIETYMGDLVGEKVYEKFGIEFPLLIKFIDANDKLSVQVHPDDKVSKERHNAFGKTEMWYVLQAEPNAQLIAGFNKKTDKEEYTQLLESKNLKQILNHENVIAGDTFFIPAGRVHAIGAGILLAEIQQTSDITYRIYDWDRVDKDGKSRELHTKLALDVLDFEYHKDYKTRYDKDLPNTQLATCPYFTTNLLTIDQPTEKDYPHIDSFIVYIAVNGQCAITGKNFETITLQKGETILIPASIDNFVITPQSSTKLLEVYINDEQ